MLLGGLAVIAGGGHHTVHFWMVVCGHQGKKGNHYCVCHAAGVWPAASGLMQEAPPINQPLPMGLPLAALMA